MATIQFGGGVTAMRGSIAGNTFARNRSGAYVRARTKPVNPNSTQQGVVRSILTSLVTSWSSTLDATERASWATYAASIALKNKVGEVMYATGFNHFLRSNSMRRRLGLPALEPGPTVLALAEKDSTITITASVATQLVTINFDESLPWTLEPTGYLCNFAGQPKKASINFFAGPWKFAGGLVGVAGSGAQSPTTSPPYSPLVLGQKIFMYFRILRADGRLSEPFYANCIVAA